MYTVLRVTGEPADVEVVVDAINTVSPQTLTARARTDGYVAAVSKSHDWDDHVRAIEAFVKAHREQLARAAESGVSIQFDTAIEPADEEARSYKSLGCPPSLHRELGAIGAWLVLSWYARDSADE